MNTLQEARDRIAKHEKLQQLLQTEKGRVEIREVLAGGYRGPAPYSAEEVLEAACELIEVRG